MPTFPSPSPSQPPAPAHQYARAIGMLQSGQAKQAAELLAPLAAAHPTSGPLWVNLSAAWVEAGDAEKALDSAETASRLLPRDADAWANLGLANRLADRHLDAAIAFEKAIAFDRRHPNAWLQLAECHESLGDLDGAMTILDDQLAFWQQTTDRQRQRDAEVFVGLMRIAAGRVLLQQRRARGAYRYLSEAVADDPESAEANNLLGVALRQLGKPDDALRFYRRAVELDPDYAAAHLNLSHAARQLGKLETAQSAAANALKLKPRWSAAASALSSALRGQGRVDDAVNVLDSSLDEDCSLRLLSNAMSLQQYRDGQTAASLAIQHDRWRVACVKTHGPAEPTYFRNARPRSAERPLRVGFLSPDLGRHPVGYFLTGLMPRLEAVGIEGYCYSDRGFEDEVTTRLKRAATQWLGTVSWSDAELMRRIRQDRIDVLIDLAGHTEAHRLELFAQRAAPVQLSWIGYVGTTGVPNMDGLIADAIHVPLGDEGHYAEQVLRMPRGYVCYEPSNDLPPIAPRTGPQPTVLAAYHNPAKISQETVTLWSEILHRLPEATLRLQYWGMRSPGTMNWFSRQFAREGIDRDRLDFRGAVAQRKLMESYGDVAVLLDPLPYSGGLTTCEALIMGVPVVTHPGQTFASRHSASHLTTAGRPEWIAASHAEYVQTVVDLARDEQRLARERQTLRGLVASSPLCQYDTFAADFASSLRALWSERFGDAESDVLAKFCA